jgi:hypothetical protein
VKFNFKWTSGVALACSLAIATSALAQERAERHIQRHAAIGQTVKLSGHVNYYPCGTAIPTTIRVVQAPIHGTLAIRAEIVKSTDPVLGRGGKCRGDSGPGRVVYYTRTSPGSDKFKYDSSSANGVVHVEVTVD